VLADQVPQVQVVEDELRVGVTTGDRVLKTVLLEVLLQRLLLEGVPALHDHWLPHDFLTGARGT
jgi:hypothetical protein